MNISNNIKNLINIIEAEQQDPYRATVGDGVRLTAGNLAVRYGVLGALAGGVALAQKAGIIKDSPDYHDIASHAAESHRAYY